MGSRHLVTAVTMMVLVGILVVGAVVGAQKLFAPLPAETEPVAEPSPSCTTEAAQGDRLRIRDVRVNVFNAGTRTGLAGGTMRDLARRGFRRGEVGNAPRDARVRRVQVWVREGEEAAGRLVARNFGPKVKVVVPKDGDLADGVDVIVGNGYPERLGKKVGGVRVQEPVKVCG
jgi:hypothetical protein